MRQSHGSYGLPRFRSTRLWLAGVACGVLSMGGIGVLFASPAWAPPFSPNPITVGNTYVVNTTVDGTGVGACSTGGLCSFRQAVNQYDLDVGMPSSPFLHVINEDQITFSTTITSCGQLQICNGVDPVFDISEYGPVIFDNPNGVSVTVTGNGVTGTEGLGPAPADEINGGGSADLEIRSISNAPVTLSDLTITDGSAPPPPGASSPASYCGGGILNEGGTVTVNDSNVYANTAGVQGAGICNLNGTFNLNDSTVWANTITPTGPGADGGGIYNGMFSNLYVNDSNIYANGDGNAGSGLDGGGIYNAQSRVQLFSSSVEANGAGNDGGGSTMHKATCGSLAPPSFPTAPETTEGGSTMNEAACSKSCPLHRRGQHRRNSWSWRGDLQRLWRLLPRRGGGSHWQPPGQRLPTAVFELSRLSNETARNLITRLAEARRASVL